MCKEFSRIVCVSLFSYQGCLSCDSSFILSLRFHLVKYFFQLFPKCFFRSVLCCCFQQLWHLIMSFAVCQHLFSFFETFLSFQNEKSASLRSGFQYNILFSLRQVYFLFFSYFFRLIYIPCTRACLKNIWICLF